MYKYLAQIILRGSMPENTLGTKLKSLRKKKSLTQNELSQKLDFSERYIAKIESGVQPSMEAFKKLASFFEVPIEYLISENKEMPLTAPIKNKELLEALIKVDQMNPEDQKIVLELINVFVQKGSSK
jgi:transcriptional regulator with XRE-family HTH domain